MGYLCRRSSPWKWLAELQQDMYIEINPYDGNNDGIRDGDMVWVHGPEGPKIKVMAMLTEMKTALVSIMETRGVNSVASQAPTVLKGRYARPLTRIGVTTLESYTALLTNLSRLSRACLMFSWELA